MFNKTDEFHPNVAEIELIFQVSQLSNLISKQLQPPLQCTFYISKISLGGEVEVRIKIQNSDGAIYRRIYRREVLGDQDQSSAKRD